MMTQTCAPPELLNDLICDCEPNSCDEDCCYLVNEQPCRDACQCKGALPEFDVDIEIAATMRMRRKCGASILKLWRLHSLTVTVTQSLTYTVTQNLIQINLIYNCEN